MGDVTVDVVVNGAGHRLTVAARTSLADLLRDRLALTGTHLGCEHGVCGACTVLVDGASARSCILLAAQASGSEIVTVEGLSGAGALSDVQQALARHGGLQCGFCTPGFIVAIEEVLASRTSLTEREVREALSGNVCRCTGYQGIIRAVLEVGRLREKGPEESSPAVHAPDVRR